MGDHFIWALVLFLSPRVDSFEISLSCVKNSFQSIYASFDQNLGSNRDRNQVLLWSETQIVVFSQKRERKSISLNCRNLHACCEPNLVNSFWVSFLWPTLDDGNCCPDMFEVFFLSSLEFTLICANRTTRFDSWWQLVGCCFIYRWKFSFFFCI